MVPFVVHLSKGNLVKIPEHGGGCSGNAKELRDVSRFPGKSSLFFLTARHPEIGLSGARVLELVEHCIIVVSGAFLMALENLRDFQKTSHPRPYP